MSLPATIVVRLQDLLEPLQAALNEARDVEGWNPQTLQQVIAHEFDFLGPFVTARVEHGGPDGGPSDEFLVLEFAPPGARDLAATERVFTKASARAQRGDVRGALPDLERVAREFPEVAKYRRALGQAFLVLEQWDRCEDELLKSLALDPRDPDALTLLGNLYAKRDLPAKAVPLYRRSLELKRNVYALTNVGAALAELGEPEEALRLLREAVALDPAYPNAWFGLGLLLSRFENLALLPEAIGALDHALEAAGTRAKAPEVWDAARGLLGGLSDIEAREEAKRAEALLHHVTDEEATRGGVPVHIEEASLSGILAKIEFAWVHGRDAHRVLVNRRAGIERVHQIRHELEHLRLTNLARAAQSNRWFGSTAQTRERAIRSLEADVRRLSRAGLPDHEVQTVILMWIDGLLSQLYNGPIDLLIETRLCDKHPAMRELWYYSLRQQMETNARIAEDPGTAKSTAPLVFRANTAMNGAFALWFEDQFPRRSDFVTRFQRTSAWKSAKRLYAMWQHDAAIWEPGRELTWVDQWAQVLGLADWYVWTDGNS